MNFSDLSQIDWKNIDLAKVLQGLIEKKELFLQVILSGITVIALISIFNDYRKQSEKYHQEIRQLHEKSKLIGKHNEVLKRLNAFLSGLPKELDEDQFSDRILDYAAQNNLAIVSIVPGQKRAENLHDVYKSRLSMRANDYKDVLLFIKAVESSPYALKVDSCQIITQDRSRDVKSGQPRLPILDIQMEVTLVKIKKVLQPK